MNHDVALPAKAVRPGLTIETRTRTHYHPGLIQAFGGLVKGSLNSQYGSLSNIQRHSKNKESPTGDLHMIFFVAKCVSELT